MGSCPRCASSGVKLGTVLTPIGKTRSKRVNVFECSKCNLVYYESTKE